MIVRLIVRIYNLSPTKENYYSQRNNKIDPNNTCKPTATIEALALAGWPFPQNEHYPQPEDALTALCRTGLAHAIMLQADPKANDRNPNEYWEVIAWAINDEWYPTYRPLIGPRWNWTLREVCMGLLKESRLLHQQNSPNMVTLSMSSDLSPSKTITMNSMSLLLTYRQSRKSLSMTHMVIVLPENMILQKQDGIIGIRLILSKKSGLVSAYKSDRIDKE
jgi:hypothetical protein